MGAFYLILRKMFFLVIFPVLLMTGGVIFGMITSRESRRESIF